MGTKKVANWRQSKKIRLVVIVGLLIVLGVMYVVYEKFRLWIGVMIVTILIALGLEVRGTDWDLGKVIETKSFSEAKIETDESGNWLINDVKCEKNNTNCSNFQTQEEAQELFDYCGGKTNDLYGLDRDKDGKVCEHLKSAN